jgi:shikimate kinase
VTTPRIIVLVGLMGTGKTTIARGLAQHFGADCLDTDKLVESSAGKSVRDIFSHDGEDAFRTLESDVLAQCLRSPGPVVVAGAGGIVVREENRAMLNNARSDGDIAVVWLHARPEVLVARTVKGNHRPLLDNDREGTLRSMATERAPLYGEVADVVVDVSDRSAESVISLIIESIDVPEGERRGSNE